MRKAIETQILKLRSAHGGRQGNLLPSTDEFATYRNGADGWLISDECNNATQEEMELWRDDNRLRTEEMGAAFYAAKHEYTLEKDREMEEGARTTVAKHAPLREEGTWTARERTRTIKTHDGCQKNAGWRLG
jgi:hypothetical protein